MIDTIYLIETVAEAQALVAHLDSQAVDPSRTMILGLEPQVRAWLKRQGWPSQDTVRFFDRNAHIAAARQIGSIQPLIARYFELDMQDGLIETYKNRFFYYFFYSYRKYVWSLQIMENLHRAYPLARWGIVLDSVSPRPFSILAQRFAEQHQVALETLSSAMPPAKHLKLWKKPLQWLGQGIDWLVTRLYLVAITRVRRSLVVATPAMHMTALIQDLQPQLGDVVPIYLRFNRFSQIQELLRALFWLLAPIKKSARRRLVTLPMTQFMEQTSRAQEPAIRQTMDAAVQRFINQSADILAYCGVNYVDLLLDDTSWFSDRLLRQYRLGQAEAHILDTLAPLLVLSPSSGQVYHLLGDLARLKNIPAMVIPFKTLAPPRNEPERIGARDIGEDMITNIYPLAVAQSPLAAEYMHHAGYAGRVIRSAPLLRSKIDATQRRLQRQHHQALIGEFERVILFAPSMKPIPPFYVVHTLDEVIESMTDMIQAVLQMPTTLLVLRLHPDLEALKGDIETLLSPPNHVIIDSGTQDSFATVLTLADLLVTNMSTVAEEAMYNGMPVILYDKWARYNHLNAPPVTGSVPEYVSPAYYVDSPERLASTLAWVMAHHQPNLALSNEKLGQYRFADADCEDLGDLVQNLLKG